MWDGQSESFCFAGGVENRPQAIAWHSSLAGASCELEKATEPGQVLDRLSSRKWVIVSLPSHTGTLHTANQDAPTHQAGSTPGAHRHTRQAGS